MIVLSKPCKEDWNRMSPAEKGRFCDKCTKVVTDFSAMTKEEVLKMLRSRKGENICGRFHRRHLTSPADALKAIQNVRKMNRYRLFLAALLFVFGTTLFTSCSEKPVAEKTQVIVETNLKPEEQEAFIDSAFLPVGQNGFVTPLIPEVSSILVDNPEIIQVAGIEPYYEPEPDTSSR